MAKFCFLTRQGISTSKNIVVLSYSSKTFLFLQTAFKSSARRILNSIATPAIKNLRGSSIFKDIKENIINRQTLSKKMYKYKSRIPSHALSVEKVFPLRPRVTAMFEKFTLIREVWIHEGGLMEARSVLRLGPRK